MKIVGLRLLKNFLFFILKIILLGLFVFSSITISLNCFNDIRDRYDDYKYLRGLENYGAVVYGEINNLKSNEEFYIYDYLVGEESFSKKIDKKSVESIDKKVKLVYDILNPEVSVLESDILAINSFYKRSLQSACIVYLEIYMGVIILGLLWFLLDYFKYNKLIWKEYV